MICQGTPLYFQILIQKLFFVYRKRCFERKYDTVTSLEIFPRKLRAEYFKTTKGKPHFAQCLYQAYRTRHKLFQLTQTLMPQCFREGNLHHQKARVMQIYHAVRYKQPQLLCAFCLFQKCTEISLRYCIGSNNCTMKLSLSSVIEDFWKYGHFCRKRERTEQQNSVPAQFCNKEKCINFLKVPQKNYYAFQVSVGSVEAF